MKAIISFVAFVMLLTNAIAQTTAVNTTYFFPKDSLLFTRQTGFEFQDEDAFSRSQFGNTTMIIRADSKQGIFYFVFKKKLKPDAGTAKTVKEDYGKLWSDAIPNDTEDSDVLTDHNLYAFVLLEDHGGLLLKARFQDFGNPVYWPQFDYTNCFVADVDEDGFPEFYLSCMGDSDGLDAKPYKQIVYYNDVVEKRVAWKKAKATAYYPSGNEEDVYHVDYDDVWKAMPPKMRERSADVVQQHAKVWGE